MCVLIKKFDHNFRKLWNFDNTKLCVQNGMISNTKEVESELSNKLVGLSTNDLVF